MTQQSYRITGREPLAYRLTKDRHGNPLATIENFPGLHADLTPDQLRDFALALTAISYESQHPETHLGSVPLTRDVLIEATNYADIGQSVFSLLGALFTAIRADLPDYSQGNKLAAIGEDRCEAYCAVFEGQSETLTAALKAASKPQREGEAR